MLPIKRVKAHDDSESDSARIKRARRSSKDPSTPSVAQRPISRMATRSMSGKNKFVSNTKDNPRIPNISSSEIDNDASRDNLKISRDFSPISEFDGKTAKTLKHSKNEKVKNVSSRTVSKGKQSRISVPTVREEDRKFIGARSPKPNSTDKKEVVRDEEVIRNDAVINGGTILLERKKSDMSPETANRTKENLNLPQEIPHGANIHEVTNSTTTSVNDFQLHRHVGGGHLVQEREFLSEPRPQSTGRQRLSEILQSSVHPIRSSSRGIPIPDIRAVSSGNDIYARPSISPVEARKSHTVPETSANSSEIGSNTVLIRPPTPTLNIGHSEARAQKMANKGQVSPTQSQAQRPLLMSVNPPSTSSVPTLSSVPRNVSSSHIGDVIPPRPGITVYRPSFQRNVAQFEQIDSVRTLHLATTTEQIVPSIQVAENHDAVLRRYPSSDHRFELKQAQEIARIRKYFIILCLILISGICVMTTISLLANAALWMILRQRSSDSAPVQMNIDQLTKAMQKFESKMPEMEELEGLNGHIFLQISQIQNRLENWQGEVGKVLAETTATEEKYQKLLMRKNEHKRHIASLDSTAKIVQDGGEKALTDVRNSFDSMASDITEMKYARFLLGPDLRDMDDNLNQIEAVANEVFDAIKHVHKDSLSKVSRGSAEFESLSEKAKEMSNLATMTHDIEEDAFQKYVKLGQDLNMKISRDEIVKRILAYVGSLEDLKLGPDYASIRSGGTIVHGDEYTSAQVGRTNFQQALHNLGFGHTTDFGEPPEVVISSDKDEDSCWCFGGNAGKLTVKLGSAIIPETVVIQYSTLREGWELRAPQKFKVLGFGNLEDESNPTVLIDSAQFDTKGPPIQFFHVSELKFHREFRYISLCIESNNNVNSWSNGETCLSQFSVHGSLL